MSASPIRVMRRRAVLAVASVALAVSVLAACALHSARARAAASLRGASVRALAAVLPSPDVALTGGARWVRAVSVEEPGAAGADGIGFPDSEPGSGAIFAPRAAYAPREERP